MDSEEFVSRIKQVVEDTCISDCIGMYRNPPGGAPTEDLLELSKWYESLSDGGKKMVERAMRDAVRGAVFGFFCVLDGVRAIEGPEGPGAKGSLELHYVNGSA